MLREFFRLFFSLLRQIALWVWTAIRYAAPRLWSGVRRFVGWVAAGRIRSRVALVLVVILGLCGGFRAIRYFMILRDPRNETFTTWWTADPDERQQFITDRNRVACEGAPFILPTDGYIGLLYGDPRGPYSEDRRHQGIDIFSPTGPGETPVHAAYDGYIARHESWVSAVIQRIPDDPLQPGRQIWLYYAHMAPISGTTDYIEEAFPPGIREVFVERGTLLGYTGNYSGTPTGVGVHLHFSIVLDDGYGTYRNELYFDNTIDPSRYLGIPVNYGCAPDVLTCSLEPICANAYLGEGGS